MRAWCLAAALLLGPTLAVAAASPAPTTVPATAPVSTPAPTTPGAIVLRQHVTDLTGTLTAAQIAELEAPLVALEKRKGSQLTVLIVDTTGDLPIEQFALAVAEKNKLGRRKIDDGLLLLIAKNDRKARIEVGYGLEGAVTDALSSRVIREFLAPHFRQGDYFGGIKEATATLVKLIDGEPLPPPMAADSEEKSQSSIVFAVLLGLFIGLFAGGTGLKPVTLRRLGAGAIAAGLAWLFFSVGFFALIAALIAFFASNSAGGRFGSGGGSWGSFPGGGGWGGSSGGGGGWSGGGGGSFGGGGASGGW